MFVALLALAVIGGTILVVRSSDEASHVASGIDWKPCRSFGQGVECATVDVPFDHFSADDRTLPLAISRVVARAQRDRIGSLLFNVGGPGFGEVETVRNIAAALPDSIRDRFDVVAWDPRGTGRSRGVDCRFDVEPLLNADSTPDDPTEVAEIEELTQDFAETCAKVVGKELLSVIGTDQTIRDMDLLRNALGDEQLTYLGFSYGTYLGSQYALEYPDRVRALVLDAPVDPTKDTIEGERSQRAGFQTAFEAFLSGCTGTDVCGRSGEVEMRDLHAKARARAEGGRLFGERASSEKSAEVTPGNFDTGVSEALYFGSDGYFRLAAAIETAADGDGSMVLELADEYNQRSEDGSYGPELQAFQAIYCRDHGAPKPDAWRSAQQSFAEIAPDFGGSGLPYEHWCASWPVPGRAVPAQSFDPDLPATVIIAATNDPATPINEGEGLAAVLPNSRLVYVTSAAHTNALDRNECVDAVWVPYLLTGAVPKSSEIRC